MLALDGAGAVTFRSFTSVAGVRPATGVTAATYIVPNPSIAICDAIRTAAPGAAVYEATSHTLLEAMLDPMSAPSSELRAERGWPGTLGCVWLDYCGTFDSKAGRKRKRDIIALLTNRLLRRPGLLAVTLSERAGHSLTRTARWTSW
jgi:hypothetical protein